MPDDFAEETTDPVEADRRNFFKVEKWTKDTLHVEQMLYAGNRIHEARAIFAAAIKHRPAIRITIRQGIRVIDKWPRELFDAVDS